MEILTLNSISKKADAVLDGYKFVAESQNPVGVLVRSCNMLEWQTPSSVLAVARAGAGVNNIPCEDYAKKGICVFNAPGANSNAVKELVVATMILAARNLYGAMTWAQALTGESIEKQVEKGKAQFAGSEIMGKMLCILGLGAVGRKVAKAAHDLGMSVTGYDPFLSDAAKAEIPFVEVFNDIEKSYANADFISLHMPYNAETHHLLNKNTLDKMKDGVIIINAARGELADNAAVKAAIESGKVRSYVVDFPNSEVLGEKGFIVTPHIGASTEEAEDNCAVAAAQELKDYIENGNIVNSVNLPALTLKKDKAHRAAVISKEGAAIAKKGVSATKKGYTYTLIESDEPINLETLLCEGVIRARIIY